MITFTGKSHFTVEFFLIIDPSILWVIASKVKERAWSHRSRVKEGFRMVEEEGCHRWRKKEKVWVEMWLVRNNRYVCGGVRDRHYI